MAGLSEPSLPFVIPHIEGLSRCIVRQWAWENFFILREISFTAPVALVPVIASTPRT